MAIPLKTPINNQRSASLIKPDPAIHGLVVKIIKWRSGNFQGAKISAKEWRTYREHLSTISKSKNPQEIKQTLKQTYDTIKANAGFEQ